MHLFQYIQHRFTHSRGSSILVLCVLILLAGCASPQQPRIGASLSVVEAVNTDSASGFARVTEPRPFVFPQDHGPHPEYQIEWWYYTGNLRATDGRHFGFQLTFFRSGLHPDPAARASDWAASSIYMAHFALVDVASGQFYYFERFSRAGAGLAGAAGDPFRVFLEDWSAEGSGPQGMQMYLHAAQDGIALDLRLDSVKPPVLHGNQGVSQKGAEVGNASYYYSLTRMETTGTVQVDGTTYNVQGLSWMDREFSTSVLEEGALGWDWFSLQLDTGHDLMLYAIRHADPDKSRFFGVLVAPDGATRQLDAEQVQLAVLDTWRSPHTGAEYPAGWRLELPGEALTLTITPLLADQELLTAVAYWEGAVALAGSKARQPVNGHGYVELTGYADTPQE